MLPTDQILTTWHAFKSHYTERDSRYLRIDNAVRGDWVVLDPDNEKIEPRSPNMIQVALEDTADAASQVPTIRVQPRRNNVSSKKQAQSMEYIAASYFDYSQMELMVPESVQDLGAYGMSAWVVWPDFDERMPIIERRDPKTCYPEPGLRAGQKARRCIFARQVLFSNLEDEWQLMIQDFMQDEFGKWIKDRLNVTLLEWFDEDEYMVAAIITASPTGIYALSAVEGPEIPVVLERIPNKLKVCPVVINRRPTLDGEFRGQYDQTIGIQEAHIRLMGLVMDYSDQAVYSDIWVKDLIGDLPWGGGAYIELGPQGAIGRVPPAVSSLNVQQDLQNLVDAMHLGGRWPKSRPGEIDQAIASAKFVEATAGMMNTTIMAYHQILKRGMEHALRLCFITDQKFFPGEKTIVGIFKNQEFVESYNPAKDIDPNHKIRAEYGLGLGRDPAQSGVLMIQYQKEGHISKEFVQENIDGLTDIEREQVRIDAEQFEAMMMGDLVQFLQSGDPKAKQALIDVWDAREKGEDMREIYRKYVVEPMQNQGPTPTPGLPPGPPGSGGPPMGGPGPMGGGAGPGGPPVPPPPQVAQLMNKLSTPAGPGGMLGTSIPPVMAGAGGGR